MADWLSLTELGMLSMLHRCWCVVSRIPWYLCTWLMSPFSLLLSTVLHKISALLSCFAYYTIAVRVG